MLEKEPQEARRLLLGGEKRAGAGSLPRVSGTNFAMFSKKERSDKAVIENVIKNGRTTQSDNLSLKFLGLNGLLSPGNNRYSFVVSNKVAKRAVVRNLLKRRGRYIVRKNSVKIKTPFACVFFFKPHAVGLGFKELEKDLLAILSRAGLI